jgi:hypothetical protein
MNGGYSQQARVLLAAASQPPRPRMSAVRYARQHRARMTPERRAELDREWE